MTPPSDHFRHPYDTHLSSGLRFLTELIAWVAGPWAVARWSPWLIVPALALLVGLPAVFSTINDKRTVIIATPGPIRVAVELLLYSVALIAPWYVWPTVVATAAAVIVVASLAMGLPRFRWLLDRAPSQSGSD